MMRPLALEDESLFERLERVCPSESKNAGVDGPRTYEPAQEEPGEEIPPNTPEEEGILPEEEDEAQALLESAKIITF